MKGISLPMGNDVNEQRRRLRLLTNVDLFEVKKATNDNDGSIQVGDGLNEEPICNTTYQEAKFANPIKVSTLIAEAEGVSPNLEVHGSKVGEHRKRLKDQASKPTSTS